MITTNCVNCGAGGQHLVVSLGKQPLANSYLTREQLEQSEPRYPLDFYLCPECMLSHIAVVATSEDIFSDYAYFSSYSTTWLEHAERYTGMICERLGLGPDSFAVEIASNDGYLLQYMHARGVPCLGIEPAANIAAVAREKGIDTEVCFWGAETATRLLGSRPGADLIIGNNVFAHTPDPNDLIEGIRLFLKPEGVATLEFPHLYRLIGETQFDTIYHEHFSYYALFVVEKMAANHGMAVFDVEELPTHGGSLRVYLRHADHHALSVSGRVAEVRNRELEAGMNTRAYYDRFGANVEKVRAGLLAFLAEARQAGKRVAAYGAPAKGNTLLNYCGVTAGDILYTLDRNPHKQGLHLPGTHIPIRAPEFAAEDQPDYMLILPWNLKKEIMEQMAHVRDWGCRFVVPIPELRVL